MSEVGVKLTGDNSEFRAMMAEAVKDAQKYAGDLTGKVGDKLAGMKDVANAISTSLGLNLEKLADNTARFFTGMTKEAEESYNRIGELTAQIADQNIKAMRDRLTAEQQLKLALKDQESAQRKVGEAVEKENIALQMTPSLVDAIRSPSLALALLYARREESAQAVVKHEEALKDQIKSNAEVERLRSEEKQRQSQLAEKQAQYDKAEEEHAVKGLGYTEQLAALERNVLTAKELLAKAEEGSIEQANRRLELQKTEFALSDAQLKQEQESRLSIAQQQEQALLLAKAKKPLTEGERNALEAMVGAITDQVKWSANLNGVEQTRLEIAALQTQEKKNQKAIDDILKKGVENLSEDELHQIELINGQNDEITRQINLRLKAIKTTEEQADTSEKVLTTEQKITAEIKAQTKAKNDAVTAGGTYMFAQKPLTHEDLANTSDAALIEMIKRAKQSASTFDPTSPNFDRSLLNAGSVATNFLAAGYNQSAYNTVANAAQAELDLRNGIRSGKINLGNFQGDPMYFDKIAQDVTTSQPLANEIKNNLQTMNGYLAAMHSGFSTAFNMPTPTN